MQSCILDCRTVAIVKELAVEKKNGANGEFESKSILFRIAVDRPYKASRQENGKTVTGHPTDFWLAKATGQTAQAFADYCTAKKEDGKLQSRRLLLSGNFENYEKPKVQHTVLPVTIGGVMYNIEADVPVENNQAVIFIVDEMKFLDSVNSKPQAAAPATPVAVAVPVGAVPAGQPVTVQAGTIAGQQAPIPQPQPQIPVQQAQPAVAQTQAVTVQAAPAQAVTVQAGAAGFTQGAMNAPTVPDGFSINGDATPF